MIMSNGNIFRITSGNPKQTQHIGVEIGKLAQKGDVLLLIGDLGTGKTCLTQGIAWGLGIKEYTSSPSFMVVKQYQGRIPLYHIDLYRLDQVAEILNLGLDDYLYGQGICVIEWADRGLETLPEENLLIRMSHISNIRRSLQLEPRGKRYTELLSELRFHLSHLERFQTDRCN